MYQFENAQNLGLDSANGYNLSLSGTPTSETGDAQQGTSCVNLDAAADGLSGSNSVFNTPPGTNFTVGAWARIDDDSHSGDADVIHKRSAGVGGLKLYALRPDHRVACLVQGVGEAEASSASGSWVANQWWHGMCRFVAASEQLDLTLDGMPSAVQTTNGIAGEGHPLTISDVSSPDPVLGCVDEVFFVKRVLSDDALQRVYACGVDGVRCTCDGDTPTAYVNCGRLHPNCNALPLCSDAQPTFLD